MNRIIQGIVCLAVHKKEGTINGKIISIILKSVMQYINIIMVGNVLVITVNIEKSTLLSKIFIGSEISGID